MPPELEELEQGKQDTATAGQQPAQPDSAVAGKDAGTGTGTDTSGADGKQGDAGKDGEGKDGAPKSALEAVLKVVGDKRDAAAKEHDAQEAAQAEAGKDKDGKQGGDKADGETDLTVGKVDEAEWKALPARTRQRITQFRAKVRAQDETIQGMSPKAQTYDELVGYCRTAGLMPDDFTEGLEIMRLVKQDPAKAWERIQPILKTLQEHVGEALPDDLKAEVEDGKITEARAKELARARKEQERLSQQSEQRTAADRERQVRDDSKRYADSVTRSVREWESTWKSSDPDYKRKAPRVWERMMVLLQAERELTPEKAVEVAKQARKDVEDWLKELMPPKQGKEPVPQGGSGPTQKKPASAIEAARQALQRVAA